jgi:hypothetical protein
MIRTLPTLARLRALQEEVAARGGDVLTLRFALDRTAHFTADAELEMVEAAGFSAAKVTIGRDDKEATVKVRVGKGVGRSGRVELRFRSTGRHASGATVVTFATVAVKLGDGP